MACLKSVMNGRDLSAGSFQCTKDQALCSWLESSGDERPGLESLFPQLTCVVPLFPHFCVLRAKGKDQKRVLIEHK